MSVYYEYHLIPLASLVISRAVGLTQNYRLRGYDAVQLASALVANETLLKSGQTGLTFVTSDTDLIQAASAENLPTDNPNLHP